MVGLGEVAASPPEAVVAPVPEEQVQAVAGDPAQTPGEVGLPEAPDPAAREQEPRLPMSGVVEAVVPLVVAAGTIAGTAVGRPRFPQKTLVDSAKQTSSLT